MPRDPEAPVVGVMVRLPAGLHYKVRLRALRDGTSLNKLVIAALEAALGTDWKFMTARKGRGK